MKLDVFRQKFGDLFMDVLDGDVPLEEVHKEIKQAVLEQYHYHKHMCSRAYEFLALFSDIDDIEGYGAATQENEYYEGWDAMPPRGHSDLEYPTKSNVSVPSDLKQDGVSDQNQRKLATYDEMVANGYTMTADGFWIMENKKWTLPVELDGLTGECLITLPDDLLEKVGWKENDQLEWIDRGDGSFELRKV